MTSTEVTQLPVLHRAFRVERQTAKKDSRQITLSLASSEPCERWFGSEVLSLEPGAIRLGRFKQGAALLFNHNHDQHLGRIQHPRIEGGKLVVDAVFSKSALGEEKYQDALAGILVDSSIGYIVHRYEVDEDTAAYTAIDWEPIEGSLCTIPADVSTGIGRSENSKTYPVQIQTRTHKMNTPTEHTENPPRLTRTDAAHHSEKIRELAAFFKTRPTFNNLGLDFDILAEVAISEQKTHREFQAGVVAQLPRHQPSGWMERMDEPSSGAGGIVTGGFDHRSIGGQIVARPEFQQLLRGGKKSLSFELPGVSNIRALMARTTLGSGNYGGTVEHAGAPPAFAQQRLTIMDLLAQGSTGAGSIRYPRENSFTSGAETVGEAGLKPEQDFDIEPVDAAVKKVAAWCRLSSELIQDSPAAAAYINARLAFAVIRAEETQILAGDGLGNNMLGILSTPGLQAQVKGADSAPDAIRRAIGKIDANSEFVSSGISIHPLDWQAIELLKTTTGEYLVGNVFLRDEMGMLVKAPSLWGKPICVTKAQPQGTALVGAFDVAAQLFRRTGLLVELSNTDGDNFTRNLVTVLAELRAALAVYSPSAFCEVSGL